MKVNKYLDSTYLKTPAQSGLTEAETLQTVLDLTQEAIDNNIFAVMIRPDYIKEVRQYINDKASEVVLGTVIGFHEGTYTVDQKLAEATKAIEDGVDELDYVINYEAYKAGQLDLVKDEFVRGTQLALDNYKVAKWIIEIAALNNDQIADLTAKIWAWSQENFEARYYPGIFVKSSTGFYKTEEGKPNGATVEGVTIMLDNAGDLPVKAAGGVRTHKDAVNMINMGVKRIGTSSALALTKDETVEGGY